MGPDPRLVCDINIDMDVGLDTDMYIGIDVDRGQQLCQGRKNKRKRSSGDPMN